MADTYTDTSGSDPFGGQTIDQLVSKSSAGKSPIANLQRLEAQDEALTAAKTKEMAPLYKQREDLANREQADLDQRLAAIKPWQPEKAPNPTDYMTDPLKAFGSYGMLFAQLASVLTHQPMINSLNAGAAAMNAVHQGDVEAYKNAYQAFKDNTQLALDTHKAQMEDWRALKEKYGEELAGKDGEIAAFAAKWNDPLVAGARQAGMFEHIETAMDTRERTALEMKRTLQEISTNEPKAELAAMITAFTKEQDPAKKAALQDKIRTLATTIQDAEQKKSDFQPVQVPETVGADGKPVPARTILYSPSQHAATDLAGNPIPVPAQMSKMGSQVPGGSAPALSAADKASSGAQAASGEPLNQVVPGYSKDATAMRQQVRQAAIEQIKKETGLDDAGAGLELANRSIEFQAGKKSVGQLDTLRGATIAAVKQLDFNADKASEEMAKLGSSDLSPIINAIARGEEKWTGDPAYSGLYFYMHGAAMESARIQSGGQASVAQLNEGAAKEAEKWANINMTPASWQEVKQAMHDEGVNRIQNFADAMEYQRLGGPKPAPSQSQGATSLPAAARSSLKEGIVTTFKNGQSWTLRNGQPVQVQ